MRTDKINKPELADIIRLNGDKFLTEYKLTPKQHSVLTDIEVCRTSKLGYHLDRCDQCGHLDAAYNSCRNRHCPKCQGISRRKWINKRIDDILPVPYYHVVFTISHKLFPITRHNKSLVYKLIFNSAADTLKSFGKDKRWLGGEIGFFGILHTWGQTLWSHPHVHFLVPGGAIAPDGTWTKPKYKSKFLFPVKALSKVFRAKFVSALQRAFGNNEIEFGEQQKRLEDPDEFNKWLKVLVRRDWIVYCKAPFRKPEAVLKYVGRYTHRVAISNSRFLPADKGFVRFKYSDTKAKQKREMTLPANEFIRRFLWHILPEGFHRIRHYGFLANGKAREKLASIREILISKVKSVIKKKEPQLIGMPCPICKVGRLLTAIIHTWNGKSFLVRPELLAASF